MQKQTTYMAWRVCVDRGIGDRPASQEHFMVVQMARKADWTQVHRTYMCPRLYSGVVGETSRRHRPAEHNTARQYLHQS